MRQKGTLIVIEGLDGSGKATQAARLTQALRAEGKAVLPISFPDYESKSSTLVRMYLAGEIGGVGEVNAYAASGFYAADRYISFVTGWKKQYLAGHTIIADRYTTSNAAHQMAKLPRGEWDSYLDWLCDYEFKRMELPRPDRVVYLDMDPETSRRLIEGRYKGDAARQDIHERDLDYLAKCREAALYAAGHLGWQVVSCCENGEPLPVETIAQRIRGTIDV